MILIHVYRDDTFETEFGLGCPKRAAYLAAKDGAVRTLCADVQAPEFWLVMRDFSREKLSVGPYLRWQALKGGVPGWMLWAAKCTTEFGAWFSDLAPEPLDENKERILRHIERRTQVSLGVLVNLCRPLEESYINDLLDMLTKEAKIKKSASEKGQKAIFYSTY